MYTSHLDLKITLKFVLKSLLLVMFNMLKLETGAKVLEMENKY